MSKDTFLIRVLPVCVVLAAMATGSPGASAASTHYAIVEDVCHAPQNPGTVMCEAQERKLVRRGTPGARPVKLAGGATKAAAIGPAGGMTPSDLAKAYGLNTTGGSGQTVAIVLPYNDPNIEADLQTFDARYGLPRCTIANGCLRVVGQTGSPTPLPVNDTTGWSKSDAITVEVTHAVCQRCRIILVEANGPSQLDTAAAENAAAALHATEINNSFGLLETSADPTVEAAFNQPGIVVTAASGIHGYYMFDLFAQANALQTPASYNTVVAVGATSLHLTDTGDRSSETVWNSDGPRDENQQEAGAPLGATGGGCSKMFDAQQWQTALAVWGETGCGSKRLVADVSAVGDPNTGFDVYSSYDYGPGAPGWGTFGGTVLSASIITAAYGLAGGAQGISYPALTLYGHLRNAYDVTEGGNGWCAGLLAADCGTPSASGIVDCAFTANGPAPSNRACAGLPGYDGPSGVGTPNGLTMFHKTGPAAVIRGPHAVAPKTAETWRAAARDPFPGGAVTSYIWGWGDGSPNTNETSGSASHSYRTPGTRTIRITMRDTYGVTGVVTFVVKVTAPKRPSSIGKPRISGVLRVGSRLVASAGRWLAFPAPTFSFRWQRCRSTCTNIAHVTGNTYTPTRADRGATLRVIVTAKNTAGSSSTASNRVGPVK